MAKCQNFSEIEQLCNSEEFQQLNYENVKSYLENTVGLNLDYFVSNGVSIEGMPSQGYGTGRGYVAQTILKSSQSNISKTTDDIIKKGNQQTYVERLQQQRKRTNSLPNKVFPPLC